MYIHVYQAAKQMIGAIQPLPSSAIPQCGKPMGGHSLAVFFLPSSGLFESAALLPTVLSQEALRCLDNRQSPSLPLTWD